MSILPNTPPPSGYSPSPPPSGVGKGWKIAGFGCLGLFLLAAVGGVLLVRSVKDKINHPSKTDVLGIAVMAGKAGLDGAKLHQAIVDYHGQYGHYPKSLIDLYSSGSIDGKLLHNDLDDSPNPAHVSWRYTPPAEGAPGNTPILEEPYHITVGGSTQPGKITITLDGKSQTNAGAGSQTHPAP